LSPLRLTVLVDQFPELSETFIASELHELQRLGHEVQVESAVHATNANHAAAEDLQVAYLSDAGWRERIGSVTWLAARHPLGVLRDLAARRRWQRAEPVRRLREIAPAARRAARSCSDHLHAHFGAGAALDAMRLGDLLGKPFSFATHGYDIFQSPANLAEKHRRAAFAVSACEYSVEHLRSVLGREVTPRLHRLVVGVDGDRFARRTPYPGGSTVVAIGRLVEKKGFADLIDAAGLLKARGCAVRVRIVGGGPLRQALDERVAERDAPVELLGPRSPEEVREVLEDADLLAMPCVVAANGDRDTMPVVVKEALAMEIPVVATDEVGLPEVVKPGWGRLAPPHDPEALAAALYDLLGLPPEERARMGRVGREFVLAECNLTRETERLVALIRS
jgi:glycosyltransferase involved in cell wall biosynthesis